MKTRSIPVQTRAATAPRPRPRPRWTATLLAATVGGGLLAGCALPPKENPQLQTLTEQALGLSQQAAPSVQRGWWEVYGDAQLNGLVEQMFAQNTRLAEMLARLRNARAQVEAASADLAPGFRFNGSAERQHFSEHALYPPPLGGSDRWQTNLTTDLSWDIDFWGRQAALVTQARDQALASALDVRATELLVAGSLAQAYIDLYRAHAHADIAKRSEEQRQKILDLTRKRLVAGLETKVELREAEGALPQARLARLQAEATAELATHELALIAGQGADAYAQIKRPQLNVEAQLPLPAELPADLLGRRPDILAARARVEAALSGRKAAKAAFYPNISLSAFVGLRALGVDTLFQSHSGTYGGGPAISLPLFEAVSLKAGYRSANAEYDAAVADYNGTVLQAVQQVADRLTLLRSYAQQIVQSHDRLSAAEDAYTLAEKRYGAGLSDYLTVLNAETQVLDARDTHVDLLAAQAIARTQLLLELGGSFDPHSAAPPEHLAATTSPSTPSESHP